MLLKLTPQIINIQVKTARNARLILNKLYLNASVSCHLMQLVVQKGIFSRIKYYIAHKGTWTGIHNSIQYIIRHDNGLVNLSCNTPVTNLKSGFVYSAFCLSTRYYYK